MRRLLPALLACLPLLAQEPYQPTPVELDLIEQRAEALSQQVRALSNAVHFLRERDYEALNLTGGILGWAREVDPSLPTY